MATVLAGDVISNIPVAFRNAAGSIVPMPKGQPPRVSIDDASVGEVVLGADNASVDFTPAQPAVADREVMIALVATNDDGGTVMVSGQFSVGAASAPAPAPEPAADTHAVDGAFVEGEITTRPLN